MCQRSEDFPIWPVHVCRIQHNEFAAEVVLAQPIIPQHVDRDLHQRHRAAVAEQIRRCLLDRTLGSPQPQAEFEVEAKPLARLRLNGAVGILDTKYDELNVVNGGANLSGARFVRAPKLTLNGSASYTIPAGRSGNVELQADARYTSLQYYYITPQDRVNRYLLTQPGYTIANARISFTSADNRVTISAYIDNLFDVDFRNHALPQANPVQGITGDTVEWGDPRTYGGSVIFRF